MDDIILEVNGTPYTGWTSVSVSDGMEQISGTFNFSTSILDTDLFPVDEGSTCRVLINNIAVITGFIESVDVDYDASSHNITVSGRDKTCDLIDSTISGNIELKTGITLKRIIEKTLSNLGITNIKVIDNVGDIRAFTTSELVSASINENAFNFIEKYARKRQVLLTSNGDGNIVMTRASEDLLDIKLLQQKKNKSNNILSGSFSTSTDKRFNSYIVKSQSNPSIDDFSLGDNVVNLKGTATDTGVRNTRQLVIIAENASNNNECKQRAIWEANLRRSRSKAYNISVQGYSLNESGSAIWEKNKLVQVVDEYADINKIMMISGINYSKSLDSGSIVTLSLVDKDAYTLQASLDKLDQRNEDTKAAKKLQNKDFKYGYS